MPIVQPNEPSVDIEANSRSPSAKKVERAPNLFGAIFGPQKPARPIKLQEQYVVEPLFYILTLLCLDIVIDLPSFLR